MQEYYEILGLSVNATDEEIENAYKTLKNKYSRERFLEGEEGNIAARNLTRLETAYEEIKNSRAFEKTDEDRGDYAEITRLIKEGKLDVAQGKLDVSSERSAEWHYLQSVIFYKKNWVNESKKQLEIALSLEPDNAKYKNSYEKLKGKMQYAEKQFHSGNANYSTAAGRGQMGGDECGSMADCCATWCCMNMLCNGCCR